MAFFKGSLRSHSLGMDTGLAVVLPFDRATVPEAECPVVYLLHGHGENADVWTRMTSAERYANAYGVALVMPEVQRSFYTDMAMGLSFVGASPDNDEFINVDLVGRTAGRLPAAVSSERPAGRSLRGWSFHGRLWGN